MPLFHDLPDLEELSFGCQGLSFLTGNLWRQLSIGMFVFLRPWTIIRRLYRDPYLTVIRFLSNRRVSQWSVKGHPTIKWNFRSLQEKFEYCVHEESKALKNERFVHGPLAMLLKYVAGERVVYIHGYVSIKKCF